MRFGVLLRQARREARGSAGRLCFFVICLSVGVAGVVAVAGFSEGLQQALREEARPLLAADLAVKGRMPMPPELTTILSSLPGVRFSFTQEMVTIVAAPPGVQKPGESTLVELKVIGGEYPFYGDLRLDPPHPLAGLLNDQTALAAPELLARLRLKEGDHLMIGGAPFRIAGRVLAEPDRVGISFSFGPRVMITASGLSRTQLLGQGSRVTYRTLIKLPGEASINQVNALAATVRREMPNVRYYEVETFEEAQPALRDALKRAGRFLRLAALLSLLIGGIGVAQTVRAWIAGRLDAMAVLRCLGFRPRDVFFLYTIQALGLGLAGSLAGSLIGAGVLGVVSQSLSGLFPALKVTPWQPGAFLEGIALGLGIALLFSLSPLLAVRRVPPVRVLRHQAEPLPPGPWARVLIPLGLLGGVWLIAATQTRSLGLSLGFAVGLAGIALVLAAAAWGLGRLTARAPRRAPVWMRHGLQAMGRPGAGAIGSTTALGLGGLVVLSLALIERNLSTQLAAELPRNAPTAFLVDVQPDQWESLQTIFRQEGAESWDAAPLVTGRLAAIDGRPAALLLDEQERGRRRWVFTREQRLSFMEQLPPDNRILAGSWRADPGRPGVSVEEEFARDLGVKVGSQLTFDIQGVSIHLPVTSIRSVEWRSFGINFFLVAEPGRLESAPHSLVVNARFPRRVEFRIRDRISALFPNIVMIPIREMLDKVVRILGRVGDGVRFIGWFTVAAGCAILVGAVGAGNVRRGREVALFKTLGMTRGRVAAVYALEFAVLGLTAGVIGTAGAVGLAWGILRYGLDLKWSHEPLLWAFGVAGTALLSMLAGLAASLPALRRKPLEVLTRIMHEG